MKCLYILILSNFYIRVCLGLTWGECSLLTYRMADLYAACNNWPKWCSPKPNTYLPGHYLIYTSLNKVSDKGEFGICLCEDCTKIRFSDLAEQGWDPKLILDYLASLKFFNLVYEAVERAKCVEQNVTNSFEALKYCPSAVMPTKQKMLAELISNELGCKGYSYPMKCTCRTETYLQILSPRDALNCEGAPCTSPLGSFTSLTLRQWLDTIMAIFVKVSYETFVGFKTTSKFDISAHLRGCDIFFVPSRGDS